MSMRKSLACLAAVIVTLASVRAAEPAQGVQWQNNLFKAYQLARDQNKPLVVLFEREYCEDCKGPCQSCQKLQREVLASREFNAFAGQAVFVRVPWASTDENVRKMKQSLQPERWPALFVLEARPEVINEKARIVGVQPVASYVQTLNRHLPVPARPIFPSGSWTIVNGQLKNGVKADAKLSFAADGTFVLELETQGNKSRFTGRYTYADGQLTLNSDNEVTTVRIVQVQDDRFVTEMNGQRAEWVRAGK